MDVVSEAVPRVLALEAALPTSELRGHSVTIPSAVAGVEVLPEAAALDRQAAQSDRLIR